MQYPINEQFYSIQGEGRYSGWPAVFIRLAYCNLDCDYCDTPQRNTVNVTMTANVLVERVKKFPAANLVVITGGEPLMHDLNELVGALKAAQYFVIIESNGTINPFPLPESYSVYYSLAPKAGHEVDRGLLIAADGVKIMCDLETTVADIATQLANIARVRVSDLPDLVLQPIVRSPDYLKDPAVAHTLKLSLESGVPLSLQIHKILGVN
jgi:organic radical activating enzyme